MKRRGWVIFGAVIAVSVMIGVVGVTSASWSDDEASTGNVVRTMIWLDFNYGYRAPITITNLGSALTDYQLALTIDTQTLNTAGKIRSDCKDLRFTTSDGTTEINYWIETTTLPSASTVVWVKVPSIAASPAQTTIYVYYGYSSESTSRSSGVNTFIFFDDMDNGVTNWTQTAKVKGCSYTIQSVAGQHGSNSLYIDDAAKNKTYGVYATLPAQTGTFAIDFWARPVQNSIRQEIQLTNGTRMGPELRFGNTSDSSNIQYKVGTTWSNLPTATTYSANTWYKFSLTDIRTQGSPNDTYDVYIDGSQKANDIQFQTNETGLNRLYFVTTVKAEIPKIYVDLVKVRAYAATAPTAGSPGTEEAWQ